MLKKAGAFTSEGVNLRQGDVVTAINGVTLNCNDVKLAKELLAANSLTFPCTLKLERAAGSKVVTSGGQKAQHILVVPWCSSDRVVTGARAAEFTSIPEETRLSKQSTKYGRCMV